MILYIFIFVWTYFGSKLYMKTYVIWPSSRLGIEKRRRSIILFIISIAPAILVSGFRYGIGPDYNKIYEKIFLQIESKTYLKTALSVEKGYEYLNKFVAIFTAEPVWIFFITSALIIILFFCAFYINSEDSILSILVFFICGLYFDSFNGIRQYIAIGITLCSFKFIKQHNFVKYCIGIVAASLFHTSVLMMIPLYFIKKIKMPKTIFLCICGTAFFLKQYILNLIYYIISFIPKYHEYVVRNTLENQISFSTSGLLLAIISFLVMLPVEKEMKRNETGKYLFNVALIGIGIALISGFLPFAERILYYTKTLYVISIPYALNLYRHNQNFAKYCYLGMIGAMNFIGTVFLGWYAVLPYISFFDK